MPHKSLVVQSYVVINEGCPMSIAREGTDHTLIRCDGPLGENFEIVLQDGALRALVELGNDMLEQIDSKNSDPLPAG